MAIVSEAPLEGDSYEIVVNTRRYSREDARGLIIVWCCETPVLENLDERSEREKRELR